VAQKPLDVGVGTQGDGKLGAREGGPLRQPADLDAFEEQQRVEGNAGQVHPVVHGDSSSLPAAGNQAALPV
jgi:hypothetical protein